MSKQPVLHFQKVCMLPCKPCTLTCDGMYHVVLCTIKITLLLWLYKRLFPEIGDKYAEWQQKKLKHSDSKDIGKSWEAWAKAS